MQLVDTADFPAAYTPEALAGRDFLNILRGERERDWTFLSPSAIFVPGERRISIEDFAIALVDELETPRHPRQRSAVGY